MLANLQQRRLMERWLLLVMLEMLSSNLVVIAGATAQHSPRVAAKVGAMAQQGAKLQMEGVLPRATGIITARYPAPVVITLVAMNSLYLLSIVLSRCGAPREGVQRYGRPPKGGHSSGTPDPARCTLSVCALWRRVNACARGHAQKTKEPYRQTRMALTTVNRPLAAAAGSGLAFCFGGQHFALRRSCGRSIGTSAGAGTLFGLVGCALCRLLGRAVRLRRCGGRRSFSRSGGAAFSSFTGAGLYAAAGFWRALGALG